MGSTAADVSPYPPGHYHRRLAGVPTRDLQSELALRWAFSFAHARQAGEPASERVDTVLYGLLQALVDLPGTLPPASQVMAVVELVPLQSRIARLVSPGKFPGVDSGRL